MEEQGLRLADIRGILRRRARLMVAIAGGVLLAAIFIGAILPNRYVAYTTMLIEPQTISKKLVEPGVEEGELTNRLHLMTMQILSRARLSRIIDEFGLYADLADDMTREEIISYMRTQIWVLPVLPELGIETTTRGQPLEVNTFRLYFRHEKAQTAAAVANKLSSDFIDEHIRDRVQVSGDTAEFIESELTRLSQRLVELEAQIAQIKAENAGSLPEQRAENEDRLSRMFDALRETQRRQAEAQSDADFYSQQGALARTAESRRGDVVGRAVSPALRLQELEISLGEMRAKGYTDRHPDVVRTNAEMAQLRESIAHPTADSSGPASLAEQEAGALAQRAKLRAAAETQEIERLQGEITRAQEQLARTPRVAEQIDGLQREYATLNASFQDYSNKRLEASVAANMERRQKGEQFRLLEPAVPPPDPESPNRILILGFGLLLGIALAGGTAVLLEASDSSYHDPRKLQEDVRIPVLASIPGILLDSDRLARRRRRLREVVAAGGVTLAVLLASVAGYVVVNRPGLFGGEPAAATAPAPSAAPAPAAGVAPAPSAVAPAEPSAPAAPPASG